MNVCQNLILRLFAKSSILFSQIFGVFKTPEVFQRSFDRFAVGRLYLSGDAAFCGHTVSKAGAEHFIFPENPVSDAADNVYQKKTERRKRMSAKNGDTVKVHYTGKLNDGTSFDSSLNREPLEFTIGEGKLLKKFEDSVIGMAEGDKKDISIPAAEGYGTRREELVGNIPLSQLPPDITPETGMQLQLQTPEGHPLIITITDIAEDHITVDGNHRLAGHDLNFELQLMEIA